MGLLDKAKQFVAKNDAQVKKGIGKVADVVDEKTGGKHRAQIEDVEAKAKDAVDKLPD